VYTEMQQWTDVRPAVPAEGIAKREACRRFGIHRQTRMRMLGHPAPPGYQRLTKADRPVIGPWLGRLGNDEELKIDAPGGPG